MTNQITKRYKQSELGDPRNYVHIEKSLDYFADMGLKDPLRAIRRWINTGVLLGRIKNLSPEGSQRSNRYEVFLPDIERFKNDIYRKP